MPYRALKSGLTCTGVASLAFAASLACSQLVDDFQVQEGQRADAATWNPAESCFGFEYADPACGQCVNQHCCDALDACSLDPGCQGITQCELECESEGRGCRAECAERYRGTTLYAEERTGVAFCRASHCAHACGQRCGVDYFADGCEECLERTCCTEWAALSETMETLTYATCRLHGVPDSVCGGPSDEASAAWTAFAECKQRCASSCARGEAPGDWSCLGSVPSVQRSTKNRSLQVRGRVVGVGSGSLENITVRACTMTDATCDVGLTTTRTASDGTYEVVVTPLLGESFYLFFQDDAGVWHAQSDYRHPPPAHSPVFWTTMLAPEAAMPQLRDNLGIQYDLTKAHAHVAASSCGGLTGDGLVFSSPDQPDALVFYGGDLSLPVTGKDQTDSFSNAGFVNISAPRLTIEAHLGVDGPLVARTVINVRENTMHIVSLFPGAESVSP